MSGEGEFKPNVIDQALGLRKQALRLASTSIQPVFSSAANFVPVLNVYWQTGTAPLPVVEEGLFWHWLPCERGATGWDTQARLHVRGTNLHFHDWQISQWRFLAREWHIWTKTWEPTPFADRLWIGLPSTRKGLILLYESLKTPCESLQGVPIILVGNVPGLAEQTASLLRRSLNLETEKWNGTRTQSIPAAKGGYYRLLDSSRARERVPAFPQGYSNHRHSSVLVRRS